MFECLKQEGQLSVFADDSYNVAATVDLLCKLGFDKSLSLINFKSNSKKKFLGFVIDSREFQWIVRSQIGLY